MCKILAVKAIRIYQKTLSPDHGPLKRLYPDGFCRYYPSCSEYTAQAIENNGVIVGIGLAVWRITRCNPWARGGYDPPPKLCQRNLGNSKSKILNSKEVQNGKN